MSETSSAKTALSPSGECLAKGDLSPFDLRPQQTAGAQGHHCLQRLHIEPTESVIFFKVLCGKDAAIHHAPDAWSQ